MINIEERRCEKLSGYTSLFFPLKYNEKIVSFIQQNIEIYNFNQITKEYEIPTYGLSKLIEELTVFDEVSLKTYEITQKHTSNQRNYDYRIKLYDYQKDAVEYGLCEKNKWLLLDEMGLGKTISIIHLAEELYLKGEIEHCLILCCVNTLKANWKKEIEKHSELNLGYRVLGEKISSKGNATYARVSDRCDEIKNHIDEFFIITNIETIRNDEFIKAFKKSENKIDMIVVDEIHRASSKKSKQGNNLLKLQAKYQVGLTGTLLTTSPINAYLPLKWIGEDKATLTTFKKQYCVYGGYGGHEIVGYKNLDNLKEEIENCSLRRTKDVLKDQLPEKTILDEYITMSDEHRKFYDAVKRGIREECDKVILNPQNTLALTTRLRQATVCPDILRSEDLKPVESSKLERAKEMIEDLIERGEKVVVFSSFKDPVYKLEEMLEEYIPLVCTGDTKDDAISKNIDTFQTDEAHKVLIATYEKLGTGVTLNRASYMIFLDQPYNASDYDQACDRIHRIGSKNPVFIYNLICENTIDEHINDIVNTKKDMSNYIIDNKELTDRLRRILLEGC